MQATAASAATSVLAPYGVIGAMVEQLGLDLQHNAPECALPCLATSADGLLSNAEEYYQTVTGVHRQLACANAHSATDPRRQQGVQGMLETAAANNTTIVHGQSGIAGRVKALKSKECIPVELAHQEDFHSLLRTAGKVENRICCKRK